MTVIDWDISSGLYLAPGPVQWDLPSGLDVQPRLAITWDLVSGLRFGEGPQWDLPAPLSVGEPAGTGVRRSRWRVP